MDPLKSSALKVIAGGFALSTGAFLINGILAPGPTIARSLAFGISIGFGLFLFGCWALARAKGRPGYFGLLGFLSLVGVAILWFVVEDRPPT